ncbi:UDP-N-acetylmuramoyl-tripeptide--D-alanyl-D-alanine ligase [Furfurilactobacillus milii]|uniref:UDP-N-acetylmuramoyl-tripeptide--D-alanyl-D-alanine ligase n=1 Tax=Furfurilactobacillus milii TaxID=2888272 RepID=A0A6N9I4E6_9LACO|nr:UDP-N-acetylmuramoyl-tripeptide--D-alanyl-D-alanine ligase [Furfurilactobacillus milii]MYV17296.1 UDP-N-acetylmuramoyl-tripeptide--D-alanyl-D-alanine ligase [Furfurilactobacillus milii]
MKMQLAEIAAAVDAQNELGEWSSVTVTSVHFDSRQLTAGALFVPLPGEHDGHEFIAGARAHGAVASLWAVSRAAEAPADFPVLLVDDPLTAMQALAKHWLSKINPQVVAITGSNGKTTTKDMTAGVLGTEFNVVKTYANYNNEVGVPFTVLSMDANTEVLVVEMGMDRFGQLDFLSKLVQPDVAVITMIGEAHIEFFGTRDKIADAKLEITHGLKDDGRFVFNGDEPLLTKRAENVSNEHVTFGQQSSNRLYPTSIEQDNEFHQTTFKVNAWPEETFKIPLLGDYNVNNALAALTVGQLFHIRTANLVKGLAEVNLTSNRTEWLTGLAGEAILSDIYNANPTAMKDVLTMFGDTPAAGRHVAVLGDMLELGDNADELHASVAEALDPTKIQTLYLIGPHMKALADKVMDRYAADQLHYYENDQKAQLTTDLMADLTESDEVMLKASHGEHLETVLNALQNGVAQA